MTLQVTFRSIREDTPGTKWLDMFRRSWPGWRASFLVPDNRPRASLAESVDALKYHMPELLPLWERMVALVEGDKEAARFLTFWCPPLYLLHCSQAVLIDTDGPFLIRNYDLDPRLSESTVLNSAWHGRRVIANVEAIAGVADGMNEDGLVLSLTFGGRPVSGPGFGIPLILRYVLEFCTTVAEAVGVLRRVPSHMAYNITLVDRAGTVATVYVSPDRAAVVVAKYLTTNHQLSVEWPAQALFSRTLEREAYLQGLLERPGLTSGQMTEAFLKAPLYATDFVHGFGTVYTATYRPGAGIMAMHWRGQRGWRHSLAGRVDSQRNVRYALVEAPAAPTGILPRTVAPNEQRSWVF